MGHIVLGLPYGILAKVKDRCRQHRGGVAVADAFNQMIKVADPAGGDHRHGHRVCHGAGQCDVETLSRAIAVHGGEQNLAGAERDHLARIAERIDAGRPAPAMGKDLPAHRFAGL